MEPFETTFKLQKNCYFNPLKSANVVHAQHCVSYCNCQCHACL